MNDDAMIKIVQSLGLDYNPAINSTLKFGKTIADLNKELAQFKAYAIQTAKDINTAFSSQLSSMNNKQILDQWGIPIKTIRDEAKAAIKPITEMNNTLTDTGNTVENTGDKFASNATKFYAWTRAAKEATQTIKDVEMGMIEIQRVMTDSSFVFEDYRDELFKLGVDYGQSFATVQDIALRWAQSGYNVADSLELTKTSLLALNTAELDAKNATESMIGIMAQWQLQAEDLALVMDKINLVADRNAVTSQDLVDGLLRSSGAAKIMNLSLDETIGLLTVMREASGRTGREIGNALSSIFSYIQRPGSIKTLEELGIQVFADAAKTQFRNVLDIFKDIAANWNTLSADIQDGFVKSADDAGLFNEEIATALGSMEEWNALQQRDISQATAGVYRRNYFIGMIERLSDVQGVLNNLLEAEGHAMRENEKTMESLEKKQQSLKTSAEALAVAMGEAGLADSLKVLADGGTNALNMLNSLPDGAKDAILAFTNVMLVVKTLDAGMKLFGTNVPVLNAGVKVFTGGISNLTTNVIGLGTALKTTFIANAPLMGIAALTGAIFALYNQIKKWKEEQERAIEVFNQQKDIYSELNNLIPVYEKLASKTSLTTDENEKLATTKQKIIDLLPESKKFIEDENISLQEQVEIVKDLNEVELERLRIEAQKVINNNAATYERDKEELEKTKKLYEENLELLKDLQRIELKIAQGDKTAFLTPEQEADLNMLPYILEEQREKIDKLTKITTAHEAALNAVKDSYDDLTSSIESNVDSNNNFNNSLIDTAQFISSLYKAVFTAVDEYEIFSQALKELNKEGAISRSTYEKLIKINDEFINIMGLEKDAAIDLMNAHKDKSREIIDSQIKEQEAIIEATEAKIEAYEAELMMMDELLRKRNQLAYIDDREGLVMIEGRTDISGLVDTTQTINDWKKTIEDAREKIASLKGMGSFFDEVDKGKTSTKSSKDDRKFLETIDAEIRAIKIKNDYLLQTEKLLQEQIKLAKDIEGVEGLNEQYRLTGELIEHNNKMLQSFKHEQDLVHARANEIRQQYSKFDTEKWFDSNAEQTVAYIEIYNKASKTQQEEMDKVFNIIQKLKKAWMESNLEIEKIVDTTKQLTIEQDKLLQQQRELERTNWIKKQNDLYEEQQKRLSALEQIQEKLVAIIRKRGEEEKKALDEAHKSEMDSLEQRHQERKKKYADDLDDFKKLIQGKIDALDEQYAEEDYLEQLNKEREEANRLQREIDVLSLDDSLEARNKTIELRKQLADQNEKIAKLQQKRERDLLKKSLQDQLKNHEQNVREKENIADKTYENERKRLEEDYRINKEFLEKKYSDEKVYAEARESIMRGQVEVAEGVFMDIYDAFVDFENKFGKGMGILGDIIKNDFIEQLKLAQDAINEMDYRVENLRKKYDSDYQPTDEDYGRDRSGKGDVGGDNISPKQLRPPEFANWSEKDYEEYIANKQAWEQTNDEYEKNRLNMLNMSLRYKYWGANKMNEDKYHWRDLVNWKGYGDGGKNTVTGLAMLHGTKTKPEYIFNYDQFKDLAKLIAEHKFTPYINTPKIPNTVAKQDVVLKIDNLINVEGNVTKDVVPLIKSAGNDIEETLKNLNKSGIFRPAKA